MLSIALQAPLTGLQLRYEGLAWASSVCVRPAVTGIIGLCPTAPAKVARQAKNELTRATGEKSSGSAFQTSWANWAQQRLNPRFERGKRKTDTGREHVHAEVYAQEVEKALRKAQEMARPPQRRQEDHLEALRVSQKAAEARVEAPRRAETERMRSEALKIAQAAKQRREKKSAQSTGGTRKRLFEITTLEIPRSFPKQFDTAEEAVNDEWEHHPDNPEREPEQSSYSPPGFSP